MAQHLYHDYLTHVRVQMGGGGAKEDQAGGWGNPFQRGKMKTLSHLPPPPLLNAFSLTLSSTPRLPVIELSLITISTIASLVLEATENKISTGLAPL